MRKVPGKFENRHTHTPEQDSDEESEHRSQVGESYCKRCRCVLQPVEEGILRERSAKMGGKVNDESSRIISGRAFYSRVAVLI